MEALGGPFSAFQQAKSNLPDGRRVSNWYLLNPAGDQVTGCMRLGFSPPAQSASLCPQTCGVYELLAWQMPS